MEAPHHNNVLFSERVKLLPTLVALLLLVVMLISVALAVFVNHQLNQGKLFLLLPVFLVLLAGLFSGTEIRLFSPGILFYRIYPLQLFWKKMNLKQAERITVVKQSALENFFGYGARINKNYPWSYFAAARYTLIVKLPGRNPKTLSLTNVKAFTAAVNQLGINLS